MTRCSICKNAQTKASFVDEMFFVEDRWVLVEGVPAAVCERCDRRVFSRETTEKVRRLMQDSPVPVRAEVLEVFRMS